MIATESRIFMNELLQWTLQATCVSCSRETRLLLHMGVVAYCAHCGARIQIDPAKTTFHRSSEESGYSSALSQQAPRVRS
jgi:DNA-directed RNA polymerase subunit RPC12/RpoP